MSVVPDVEQRLWRTVVRRKHQVTRTRVQLQNRLECLLEEAHLKLSSLVSDLFGTSARRMLQALADGETAPARSDGRGRLTVERSRSERELNVGGSELGAYRGRLEARVCWRSLSIRAKPLLIARSFSGIGFPPFDRSNHGSGFDVSGDQPQRGCCGSLPDVGAGEHERW